MRRVEGRRRHHTRSGRCTSADPMQSGSEMHERSDNQQYWIDPLEGDEDLDGVIAVEAE